LQKNYSLNDLSDHSDFINRHLGPNQEQQQQMLDRLGYSSLEDFIIAVVPESIRMNSPLALADSISEQDALAELNNIIEKNTVMHSLIGQGYYNSHTPAVILRNVFENPAWYTAYTPYQPEISQGRLEALLNYQTMITDLTGMEIANASMLDEATAAAEAMTLCKRISKVKTPVFFVDQDCLPQTIAVIQTRAEPVGIEVIVGDPATELDDSNCFAALLQYTGASGEVRDYSSIIDNLHQRKALAVMATDILSLLLLKSPAELGADVAIGSSQRFGVPLGYGGPHAAYMACREKYKRSLPGRLVGISRDSQNNPVYRLALQTREQHIRREKATSNICTAQVLLAVMASMYAVYHGPQGLKKIARRIHCLTQVLAKGLEQLGLSLENKQFFDTLTIESGAETAAAHQRAVQAGYNLRVIDGQRLGVSIDETVTFEDIEALWKIFNTDSTLTVSEIEKHIEETIPASLQRSDEVLSHPTFNRYHSETEMLRYLRMLSDKDIALDRAMIPLGSCTMKLNATSEMIPVTWKKVSAIHPLVPQDQAVGYRQMIAEVEEMMAVCTGYDAVSLQPNAGSQGEYAGLLAIRAYHESRGEGQRDVCLIPGSAHGTNPASAQMCGMRVVVVQCDEQGNVDMEHLKAKVLEHSEQLAALMVTYPSTHGVFEESIIEICDLIHQHGGQVYIDGANLNAMVGLCQPGQFGGDVSHLNLHKTFCIPHGGGGPGVGPVAVGKHLAPFLPSIGAADASVGPVSASAFGSASILPITWMYVRMMGREGLKQATQVAILNANYIAKRLSNYYPILYTGKNGHVAHECIVDMRPLKESSGISEEDVAKRLIDFGFHAPTMSFPVPGTLMIEPTESEPLWELDRFCEAMIKIREEIAAVESGEWDENDNPLINAPHTASVVTTDNWEHSYSRETAAFPIASLRNNKYWSPVGRVDNVYGDRNLVCSCLPISEYK
jgi:glycine dehydrogenase